MPKNDLPKNKLLPNTDYFVRLPSRTIPEGIANREVSFALKIVFGAIIIAGLSLATFSVVKSKSNNKNPLTGNFTKTQSVLAEQAPGTPNPAAITIPSLSINAPFEFLGLNPDHTIAVPVNSQDVGWFIYGPKPGEVGAAVIIGHLDSVKGQAIFANLNKINPGDKILITRDDGSLVTYRVDSLSKFSQNNFPTQAVYGSLPYAGIRLITCGGTWNKKAGHYTENLIVFGTEISLN